MWQLEKHSDTLSRLACNEQRHSDTESLCGRKASSAKSDIRHPLSMKSINIY